MDESALKTQKSADTKCAQKGHFCPLKCVFPFPTNQTIKKEPNYGQRNNKITQKLKKNTLIPNLNSTNSKQQSNFDRKSFKI